MLGHDLGILAFSAALGGVAAVMAAYVLSRLITPGAARDLSIAFGAAISTTTHARLSHHYPWRSVGLSILLSTPLVYGVMEAVHYFLGQ